jgi:hypothetical protein
MQGVTFQPNFLQQQQQQQQSTQMCCHQRQLIPKSKTRLKVRNSQRVQTLREYVAVFPEIIKYPRFNIFDDEYKII